jgi:hypothetical protein
MPLSGLILEQCRWTTRALLIESHQSTVEIPLPGDWLSQPNVGRISRKSLVIGGFVKSTIEPGRCNLEGVLVRDRIVDIEKKTDALTHPRTVIGCNPTWFINKDAEEPVPPSRHLGMHQLVPFVCGDALYYFLNSRVQRHVQTSALM